MRGVRYRVSLPSERASQRRSLDERLFARFPGLYRLFADAWMRMPLRSRLRGSFLRRFVGRACAAANRRDFDLLVLGVDPCVEHHPAEDLLPLDWDAVAHGQDGYQQVWRKMMEAFDDFRAEDYGPLADDTVKKGHQQRVPYNIIYKPKDLENFREFIYYVVSHRNDFTPVELEYAGYADKSFDDVRLSNNHMRILQGAYKKKNNRDWPYTTKTGYMYKYAETVYWEWFV